jgi:hypothetical protein
VTVPLICLSSSRLTSRTPGFLWEVALVAPNIFSADTPDDSVPDISAATAAS